MESFIGFGGLNEIKLVCFGVDGFTIFQGVKIGGHHTTNVETCFIFEWCALHGTPHKTWLFKPWVLWGWYKKLKISLLVFTILLLITLNDILSCANWLNCSKPKATRFWRTLKHIGYLCYHFRLKRVLVEYKILIIKMDIDSATIDNAKQTMWCGNFVRFECKGCSHFAQGCDTFICDQGFQFVKLSKLFNMYCDIKKIYSLDHFSLFLELVDHFNDALCLIWWKELASQIEYATFLCGRLYVLSNKSYH